MAERIEKLFGGKALIQDDKQFPLGMDAVLLSAFAKIAPGNRVCELGCGAGAALVLMAVRNPGAVFDGVEIQPEAAKLARRNIERNSLSGYVRAHEGDLRRIGALLSAGVLSCDRYDAVVCNPPYLRAGSGRPPGNPAVATAKMELACTIGEVCTAAAALLRNGRSFFLVYRTERLADLLCAMRDAGIEPKRLRFVQETPDSAPGLLLCEGRKRAQPGLRMERPLIIRSHTGDVTEEIKRFYQGESL